MRLVFLGTPEFAIPTLERLAEAGHQIVEVITQPDRPRGRGHKEAATPVKQAALRLGLPVYQPERIRRPDAVERLRAIAPDAMVVVGYGQIIPQAVIDIPRYGILNVHASLLPKYRGAAPVQWAVVNGESRTGVTIMRIDAGLDTGDMLAKAETEIGPGENAVELARRLSVLGAGLLVSALADVEAGAAKFEKQNAAQATHAPQLTKEQGRIDWSRSADVIHNLVRGLQPWPGGYTEFRGQKLHIWRTQPVAAAVPDIAPGAFLRLKPLTVACGGGSIELLEVQLEGRKRMSGQEFANGHRIAVNDTLGEHHS